MSAVSKLQNRIDELAQDLEAIIAGLKAECWPNDRPREPAPASSFDQTTQLDFTVHTPAKRPVPMLSPALYQKWYAEVRTLVQRNDRDRLLEVEDLYGPPSRGIKSLLAGAQIAEQEQFGLVDAMRQQLHILASIPAALSARMLDVELTMYSMLADDEIAAARLLLKNGFTRAAGAMAGVVLEGHLKKLLDKHSPPIKYRSTLGLADLNDLCRKNDVYELPDWRRLQHLGDLRNACAHHREPEPTKEQGQELLDGVSAFLKQQTPGNP